MKKVYTLLLFICSLSFASGQSVILVGDGAAVGDLPTAEQNAYNWALNHFGGDAAYQSFADVAANGLPAGAQAVWFHFEDDPTLPSGSAGAATAIGDFVTAGGGLLTSGFATEYLVTTGLIANAPTETINNDPAGPDAAWGVRPLTGQESNPVFAGMTETTDWADPNWGGFRTVAADVAGREAIRWWNDGSWPGTPIAGMPWWDPNNPNIPVIGSADAGSGSVMFASAPGYNWISADINGATEQATLEQLTANMINALLPQIKVVLLGDAADVSNLPTAEQNAYNWALGHYGNEATYLSFADVAANGLPATTESVWFHFEDDPTLPASSSMGAANVETFVQGGGTLLASGFATEYVLTINATTAAPTETIDNDPAGPDVAWGVRPLVGQEGNEVFFGLTETTDWADPNWGGFRTVAADVAGREAIRWWNDGSYPGTPIAGMPWWDPNNPNIPVIGAIPFGDGNAVTATAPGYNWVSADINGATEQATLEQLTANMLAFGQSAVATEILLVGEGALGDLPAGEQNAYNWALDNFPQASYTTFADLTGGVPAGVETIWYHLEDTTLVAPTATDAAGAITNFVAGGGGVLLSGFATQYATSIGATAVAPSEIIDNDPAGPDAAWGVRPLTGQEGHPFFANMTETMDWADPNWGGFRTIGAETAGREAMAWWTGGSYTGIPIAGMPWWDPNNPDIPVIGEMPTGTGSVVTATAPGYHWLNAPINDPGAQANLEQLTENILLYLYEPAPAPRLIVSSDPNPIVEGTEDGQTINIAVETATYVDPIEPTAWTVMNLPPDVSVGSIVRIDDNNATLTLSGTASDYDMDILDFTVTVPVGQLNNAGGDLTSVGEVTFDAIVEIEPTDLKVALLGDKENMMDLDPDEIAAYEWAMETFGDDAQYIWVQDMVIDPSILTETRVAWWHYDKFVDMPLLFDNPNTATVLKDYLATGRGIFLSGAATQYVVNLEVTTKGPNHVQKADMPFTNPDQWGFGTPVPEHPAFENLSNPFFTLSSPDGLREDLLSWWNLVPDFDPNTEPADRFDGSLLTSTEWDTNFELIVSTAEFTGTGDTGDVIACGAGAYDWSLPGGGINELMADLELYTFNILNYLGSHPIVGTNDLANQQLPAHAAPNPFSDRTSIFFNLEETQEVTVEILDIQGRLIKTLNTREQMPAGTHVTSWEPTDVPNGLYIYRITAGNRIGIGKLTLQR